MESDAFHREQRSRLLTLVFTDLVNSVGLKIQLGDVEAGRLISMHQDGLSDLVSRGGGREILSIGDGNFLTFETPSQAVEFALHLQDFHRKHPELPSVRVGIHMGEVTEKQQPGDSHRPPEIIGLAVDIASRIESLAKSSQILMSYPVFDNARQRLKTDILELPVEWRAHGRYVFQGSDDAHQIFEVGLKGVATFQPPSGSDKAHRDVSGDEEDTLGWRPAQGLELPDRPNWILVEKLGEGGFGDVWMVEHRKTRENHVIKFCYSSDRLRALKREVTLFRLLKETLGDRTDIARVIDYQFERSPYYLEMEFAGKHNLISWLEHHGGVESIPLDTRVEIVAQIADAIAAAHSVGVLHKDIKPSNIMVTGNLSGKPHIRVIDFGIGAISDRKLLDVNGITASGITEMEASAEYVASLTGTRLFMAPELVEGRAATTKSDIYALGVVLYQMVSGRIGQALSFGWERDIPDELLREDIKSCVDGNPDNRLVSAEELARCLRLLPERRSDLLNRKNEVQRQENSRKRRRLFYAVGALLSVLLIFVAQYALLQQEKVKVAQELHLKAEMARSDAVQQADKTKAALELAQKARYYGAIALAEAGLRESRFEKVQEVLFNEAPAGYRQWEWGWLLGQISPEDFSIKNSNIFDVKFSRDGNTLIVGCRDAIGKGYIKVLDSRTTSEILSIKTNERLVWNLDVSPDERLAATASSDNQTAIVDLTNNKIIHRIGAHTGILRDVRFSPDGKLLVSCARDKTIRVWNTQNFQKVHTILVPEDSFTELSISPDSRYVASGSLEGNARVFSLDTGKQVALLAGHTDRVLSLNFLKNNQGIITACTDRELRIFPWSPEVTTPSIEARSRIRSFETYPAQVISSPDGKSVYVGHDDGSIKKLDTESGTERAIIQVDQPLWKLSMDTQGKYLMATTRWSLRKLDLERLEGGSQSIDYDGSRNISPDVASIKMATVVKLHDQTWNYDRRNDTTSGLKMYSLKNKKFLTESAYHVYSPDRKQLIRIYPSTLGARVVSPGTGQLLRTLPNDVVAAATFSPDGKQAAIATQNAGTKVFETTNWQELYRLPRNPNGPSAVKYSPDSTMIIVGNVDGAIDCFNAKDGTLIRPVVPSGKSAVMALETSSDGKLLAVGLDNDRAIVYDLETNEELSSMTGHVRYVYSVKFNPDNTRLVTLSRDGTVKMWDVKSGRELITLFILPGGVVAQGVYFSPDNLSISIATSDNKIISTDVFPWEVDAYGPGPEPLIEKVENWKRKLRSGESPKPQ